MSDVSWSDLSAETRLRWIGKIAETHKVQDTIGDYVELCEATRWVATEGEEGRSFGYTYLLDELNESNGK